MDFTMNEAKQTLKVLEQQCKLLRQQQVTFITALERTRENAHDRIKPVQNLAQVQSYLDYHCNNSTDKRILSLFLDVCNNVADFCVKLDAMQTEMRSAGGVTEETLTLLSPTNDLSGLRAKYPHDAINHLSCDEARNFYGGVVSLIPIVLDNIREAVARMEKVQPQHLGKDDRLGAGQRSIQYSHVKAGGGSFTHNTGAQTNVSHADSSFQTSNKNKYNSQSLKPAWRPAGRLYTS
ncbi:sperm acrosome-associated protein 9 [Bufo gargarizans]|uniref:sperm acrosome-associated protein 9 n=1 Tax=Bufo gargarizans TaxID=30331 RepID=UPI001CF2DF0F|nr:sperm acrosome-associated protein 9 [Bufo gargarizans]